MMCRGSNTGTELEPDMRKTRTSSEPSWLDPRNDRKTPFTDAELDVLADDFIARMADTQAWQDLVAEVGEQQAREVVKQRFGSSRREQPDQLATGRTFTLIGAEHHPRFGGIANAGGQGVASCWTRWSRHCTLASPSPATSPITPIAASSTSRSSTRSDWPRPALCRPWAASISVGGVGPAFKPAGLGTADV